MKWIKKGLIYTASGKVPWSQNYASIPTVGLIDEEKIRVYFWSVAGEIMDGRIGYVDLDINDPKRILRISKEPVLDIGEPGTFDDCGVMPCSVIPIEGKLYLYYIGVQRCEKVPYLYFAGLAISEDGGEHFDRCSKTPILERTDREPCIRSAMTIVVEESRFKGWYVSANTWITVKGKPYPEYVVRCAESCDGVHWESNGNVAIGLQDDEFGIGRPWVVREKDSYKMWYSIRSKIQPYRMGYAESSNGRDWIRKDDEVGIERSDSGWDSEMICYPCVVDVKGKRYMFHNGNSHGASGFGYAVLDT